MTDRFHLTTRLVVPSKGWLFLILPDEILGGVRKRVWIRGTLDGKPFAATANPWKDGTHVVTVNRSIREALGLAGEVEVELDCEVLDRPILDLPMPADLAAALDADPDAAATFAALPPSHQKEFIFFLDEAKRPETRRARIETSLAILRRGRHLYEDSAARFAPDLKGL